MSASSAAPPPRSPMTFARVRPYRVCSRDALLGCERHHRYSKKAITLGWRRRVCDFPDAARSCRGQPQCKIARAAVQCRMTPGGRNRQQRQENEGPSVRKGVGDDEPGPRASGQRPSDPRGPAGDDVDVEGARPPCSSRSPAGIAFALLELSQQACWAESAAGDHDCVDVPRLPAAAFRHGREQCGGMGAAGETGCQTSDRRSKRFHRSAETAAPVGAEGQCDDIASADAPFCRMIGWVVARHVLLLDFCPPWVVCSGNHASVSNLFLCRPNSHKHILCGIHCGIVWTGRALGSIRGAAVSSAGALATGSPPSNTVLPSDIRHAGLASVIQGCRVSGKN